MRKRREQNQKKIYTFAFFADEEKKILTVTISAQNPISSYEYSIKNFSKFPDKDDLQKAAEYVKEAQNYQVDQKNRKIKIFFPVRKVAQPLELNLYPKFEETIQKYDKQIKELEEKLNKIEKAFQWLKQHQSQAISLKGLSNVEELLRMIESKQIITANRNRNRERMGQMGLEPISEKSSEISRSHISEERPKGEPFKYREISQLRPMQILTDYEGYPYFEIDQGVVTYITEDEDSDGMAILGAIPISQNNEFSVKILDLKGMTIWLGIIDAKRSADEGWSILTSASIMVSTDGKLFAGSQGFVGGLEASSFLIERDTLVRVFVDTKGGCIEWGIGEKPLYRHYHPILMNPNIDWLPRLWMWTNEQTVELLQ